MDIYDRVSAWATAAVLVMEKQDFIDVIDSVSQANTILKFADFVVKQFDPSFNLGDFNHSLEIFEQAWEVPKAYSEQDGLAQEAVRVDELVNAPDRSVEIGGAGVEAEIAEIKKVQDEHEVAQQELSKRFEHEQREQSTLDESIQKDYFDHHPDQSDGQRLQDEQKFEGAKQQGMEDLREKQQVQMDKLLEEQQKELQQLQGDQQLHAQRDFQVRQEFQQNKDDLFR